MHCRLRGFGLGLWILAALGYGVAGCGSTATQSVPHDRTGKAQSEALQSLVDTLRQENSRLKDQVAVLQGLPVSSRGVGLYSLEKVEIARYTGLYDRDLDGRIENLIVYLKPVDAQADAIKAIGEVDVELWDLDRPGGQAKVGSWHVGPEVLRKNWFVTLMTVNYRLIFDLPPNVDPKAVLTVKVVFTDYACGKVFREQAAVRVQGGG